jgi:SsrA-binding protein
MTKSDEKIQVNVIAQNRKARFDYQIIDTWEAGIKLVGLEVKALRQGNISLGESWIKVKDNTVTLVSCSITPSNVPAWQKYDHRRDRVLLLKKVQIRRLRAALQTGLTIIPLKIYFNSKGLAKLEIATAKGKKQHDKRKSIKDRDNKRYGFNS